MYRKLEKLKETLYEWLVINEIETDTKFYSIEDWKERNEDYLNDSLLVLIYEGGLHTILNFGGDTLEFDNLIESFGFYYEMGNSWNLGFYPIENYDYSKLEGSYSEKLKDKRWIDKSNLVKKLAEYQCQDCGSKDQLDSHHCYYSSGHEPWEYPLSAFRCLCRRCHYEREKTEIRIKNYFSKLTKEDLENLRLGIDRSFYWFKKECVIDYLRGINHDEVNYIQRSFNLFSNKNDV